MKKVSAKLIITALMASAALSLTAVGASAADYGGGAKPNTPAPNTSAVTGTDSAPSVLTENAVDDAIAEALKKGSDEAVVFMEEDENGKVTVQEAAIADIANSDVAVTVEIKSDSGADYSVTLDPALITEAKAINLAMDIQVNVPAETSTSGVDIPAGSIVIAPAQKGDFGMTLQVNLPASSLVGIDKNNASLFYISDNGDIVKLSNALAFNADGSATISISHASEYVISDTDIADYNGIDEDIPDNNDDDDDDDGIYTEDDDDYDSAATIFIDDEDDPADDDNPGTGVGIAFGALAVSAAAVVLTKKRK